MSLVSTEFPVPVPIPAMVFADGVCPQAGISIHRPADSTTAVMPDSLSSRIFCFFIALRPFLDPVDVVGDQAVSLPVDVRRSFRRRRLYQAEHPPVSFIDPVPEVPDVMTRLRLQVGEMSLGDVVHRYAAVDLMDIHEKRHCGLPSGRWSFLSDRKVARSATSSGKVPGFAAAIAQFSAGAAYIACPAIRHATRRSGRDTRSGRVRTRRPSARP